MEQKRSEKEWAEFSNDIDSAVDSLRNSDNDEADWCDLARDIDAAVDSLRDEGAYGGETYYEWVDRKLEEMFTYQELND